MDTWLSVDRLEDLAVPVRIATTDLTTGRPVHHDTGNITELICASTALPAVFPPVVLDGPTGPITHVDAGIAENLPMSGAYGLARPGDTIYALDVTKTPLPRNLRNPLDVLIAALVATVRNQAVSGSPGRRRAGAPQARRVVRLRPGLRLLPQRHALPPRRAVRHRRPGRHARGCLTPDPRPLGPFRIPPRARKPYVSDVRLPCISGCCGRPGPSGPVGPVGPSIRR